jgi:hypothetical protein
MTKKALLIPVFLLSVVVLSATLVSKVSAQLVVQSYESTQTLQDGQIVSLKAGNSTEVVPTTKSAEKEMFGVVTTPGASDISLSGTTSEQVFVATSGNYAVLVSSENGGVSVGDFITVSSLDGIGMKASGSDGYIIGKALSTFNPTTQSIGSTSLVSSSGAKSTVQLGRIMVALGVSHNPLQSPSHSNLPAFLITAGDTIANKAVSSSRLLLAFVLLLICCAMTASLLYSGVRTAFIAIGRNPLSKASIYRGLFQVIITSVMVFIIGIFGVYLLLRF